jgi:replicative DNA helicase
VRAGRIDTMTEYATGSGGPPGLTPPQALDAERSVLAAMMLDEGAIGRAIEQIDSTAFYRTSHMKIFDALVGLYNARVPADLITVAEELKKRGDLEAVGGTTFLAQLMDYATTAANLEQHIRIVHSKAILRQLIKATTEIQQQCYGGSQETAEILDQSEARIFAITDQRIREGFTGIRELLKPTFDNIQKLFERKVQVTGVPSGWDDLDKLTSGWQPGDLIILAGRPSMGKSSAAVNMAENAAIRQGVPVAIFSLEMSKEQLAMRLLCSQSEVSLQKVRTGYLGNEDWPRLTTGAGLLTQAPILIDDSPSLSVLELRAKCRRLKADKKLGLVVVDYLQLMRSSTQAENRVQEISQISRGLKGLAKELEVPIIALSQLSRAVEQRGGSGRPQLSDLRDSGCLTADARVLRADSGAEVTMGELLASGERNIPVWTVDDSYRVVQGTMSHVFPSGEKEVFEMRLTSGRSIKASANHPFLTLDGWRRLDQLSPGDRLAVPRRVPEPVDRQEWPEALVVLAAHMIGDGCLAPRQPLHYTSADHANLAAVEDAARHSRGRLMTLARVLKSPELHSLAESDLFWDEIHSIESLGVQPVFDATVPGMHNFIANGIVTHNSIEQDADVVLFVYREVVYKPDTAEPGKAQLIIAKQRNGPTDDVDMTFLRECTKFVPYSPVMSGETEPGF